MFLESYKRLDPLFKLFCGVALVLIVGALIVYSAIAGPAEQKTKTTTTTTSSVPASSTTTAPPLKMGPAELMEFKFLVSERDRLEQTSRANLAEIAWLKEKQNSTEEDLVEARRKMNDRWISTCKKLGIDSLKYTVNMTTGEIFPIPSKLP